MDPDKTLALLVDALENGLVVCADSYYKDLVEWINKGGFMPSLRKGQQAQELPGLNYSSRS